MQPGVLYLETHAAHPGLVRVALADAPPPTGTNVPARVRYAARFADRDAALMHTHELLRRRLVDVDARLYRTSLPAAIATRMMVEGKVDLTGVQIPVQPELYHPILDELEEGFGIKFVEETTKL